jgi:hypothetical protein
MHHRILCELSLSFTICYYMLYFVYGELFGKGLSIVCPFLPFNLILYFVCQVTFIHPSHHMRLQS